MSYMKSLVITFYIVLASGACATTDEATQTDWAGGPGVPGPVTDWGDTFDSTTDVNWYTTPGDLVLHRIALSPTVEHIVVTQFDQARSVYADDFDGDGDTDILGAAQNSNNISWWENDDGSGTSWTRHIITTSFGGANTIYGADLDGDDDIDVVGSAGGARCVAWWENLDGSGTFSTINIIATDIVGAAYAYAEDVDGDDDMDVLAVSFNHNDVLWWENDDGSGTSWTEHMVDDNLSTPCSLYATDVDGDDDIDVLSTSRTPDDVVWWSNDDGSGTFWTKHTVDGDFSHPEPVFAEDVDGDDDTDVLAGSAWDHMISWWENMDGVGGSWEEHTVATDFVGPRRVYAEDIDGDGDADVLGAARYDDHITWWENLNGSGTDWEEHNVDAYFPEPFDAYAEDVDGDGDVDVLGAAFAYDQIAWWEAVEYAPSAELNSSIYDTQGSPEWGEINWTADTPDDTTVKFRVRSSSDPGDMGDWSLNITSPGPLDTYLTDGDRYFQYKAVLGTIDGTVTPVLEDITMDWGYTDIAVTSFSADSAAGGVDVSWECADEVAGFHLYRTTGSGEAKTLPEKLNAELITGESPYAYLDAAVKESVTYSYWLEAVDVSGAADTFGPVECTRNGALPTTYTLYQSRPNPATGSATITFDLPEDAKVMLTVYDINGRKVTTVVNETLTVGTHERTVARLAPGVYVYRLDAGSFSAAKKMVVQ
jgi:hypothetical protein